MRRTIKEYEASHAMMGHQGVRKIMAWEALALTLTLTLTLALALTRGRR